MTQKKAANKAPERYADPRRVSEVQRRRSAEEMKTLSRHMPPLERGKMTIPGWIFLGALAAGAIVFVIHFPYSLIPIALLVITCVASDRAYLTRLRVHTAGREPDLCAFARAFDRRMIDPRLIRATWDEITDYLKGVRDPFPLKPTDRIVADLEIDLEDMEEIVIRIADRAGYSLKEYEKNPRYKNMQTIGDLVLFLNEQPPKTEAEPAAGPYGSPAAGSPSGQP